MYCAGMFEDKATDRGVTKTFTSFMDWYMCTRAEVQTVATLATMHTAGVDLLFSLKVFRPVTGPLSEVYSWFIFVYIRLFAYIISENHH